MKPLNTALSVLVLAGLIAFPALAFEVTPADVSGVPTFEARKVRTVPAALEGYFNCADDAANPFAYALIQRDELYHLFIKAGQDVRGWVPATLDGTTITFGTKNKGTITLSKDGKVSGGLDGNPPTELKQAK